MLDGMRNHNLYIDDVMLHPRALHILLHGLVSYHEHQVHKVLAWYDARTGGCRVCFPIWHVRSCFVYIEKL